MASRRKDRLKNVYNSFLNESTPAPVSTPDEASEPTQDPPPPSTPADTRTPEHTSTHTPHEVASHTSADTPPSTTEDTPVPPPGSTVAHTPVQTPMPTPKEHMKRTNIYLRPDQIAWLDELADKTGLGVSRSDWVRYAIDELRRSMDAHTP